MTCTKLTSLAAPAPGRKVEVSCTRLTFQHAQIIVSEMDLAERSNGSDSREAATDDKVDADTDMDAEEVQQLRALVARANYLEMDRADIQYTTKEICWNMATPKKSG